MSLTTPLSERETGDLDAWFRAANYLSAGQIYLLDNPLLNRDLTPEDIKPRLLGHWGTAPGLNLVHTHLNRLIRERDVDAIMLAGPGHGGPAEVAEAYLDGRWSEVYPEMRQDEDGLRELMRQFSFPGGIPSHAAADVPGSMHEGGELGYVLSHAHGAAMDNPDLIVVAVVGDGEFETGPLAGSWQSTAFVDPVHDGAVLPVLHLNGYKIASPTVPGRMPRESLVALLRAHGHHVLTVEGEDPAEVHQQMAAAMDEAHTRIREIQEAARGGAGAGERPSWPLVLLATPKGWTGPRTAHGLPVEGTWRAHQVPLTGVRDDPEQLALLQEWLSSYDPGSLFDEHGRVVERIRALAPRGDRRTSANPHANGGLLRRPLQVPDPRRFSVDVPTPGASTHEATKVLGDLLTEVIRANPDNFRLFGPDETASNRLDGVYEVTDKVFAEQILPVDEHLAPQGRVMEVLSEHLCQGWLEGYLLSGRHGLFSCYEAFAHIVDSMVNQYAKWLKVSARLDWRPHLSSLNYLLTSHVWRQDHNGFSHQDPGFIDHVVNKKPEFVRVYLPPDTNTLLATMAHCLSSRHHVNVVVAGKQPQFDWLDADRAALHCTRGLGIWEWASTDDGDPDVVLACAGDVPTLEALAAADLLRRHLPELAVRFVNVVDLMRLMDEDQHPHGLNARDFDAIFTRDRPVVFAYHGYPSLIHRLTYRRANHANLHVHGFREEGTTTTPFDMVMMNELDRYQLVIDVIDRVPGLGQQAALVRQEMLDARSEARAWTRVHGDDIPAVRDWAWSSDQRTRPGE